MDLTHVEWSWIAGSSATADTSLGGKFPSAPFNRPNLRYSPYAREKHSLGQVTIDGVEVDAIYLHGGNYYSSSFQVELLSDLWMFNLTTELWQWIAGNSTNNVAGVYPAAAGESSLDAYPGSRTSRGVVDYNGFVLFGGFGYDSKGELTYLNDIWSFDWTTFAWTWINGPSQAVIIEGPTSMTPAMLASYQAGRMNPGGRDEHCIAKTREGTTLYVSGGYGYTTDSAIGLLNDVWSYDLTANTGYWTWLYGSSEIVGTGYAGDGDYSVFGQEDSHVFPRRRLDHACTLSPDESQFYFFGGLAYSLDFAVNSYISMNDFWSFNVNSKQWKWISGLSDGNWTEDNTTTIALGTYDPEYVPSPRHGFGYGVNAEGDLYIYSGSAEFREYEPQRSDMWIYNVSLQQWAQVYDYPSFMGGAVYGPKHEHSANYTPNSREEPSIAVVGNDNYVLVSGGRSIGIGWWSVKSDLWMLTKYCDNANAGSIHFFSSCETCPPGTHLDAAVGSCVQCPPNTFQNESGQNFCYPCIGSVGSKAYGSIDSSVCLCDAPGYFQGDSCKPCPVGTYSKRGAATVCTQCPKNTYTNQTGSSVCINCPVGYTSTVGASICTVAPTEIVPKTPSPTPAPISRQTLVKVFGGVAVGLALVAGGFVLVQAKKKRDLARHVSLDEASKSSRSTRKASEAQHLELSVNSVDNSMRRGSWNPEPSSRRRSEQLEARALADDRENSQSSGSSGGASPKFLAAPVSPKSPVAGLLKGFGKATTPRSIPENSVDAGDLGDGL